jgi:hypothetical protein
VNGVNVTFELDEYRKYLSQLVQTRFLGIDGTLRKKKSHMAAPVIAEAIVQQQQILAPDEVIIKKGSFEQMSAMLTQY